MTEAYHNPTVRYRPEIDGLRAVAVLPVIFYHAGFTLFSGGYVGVDVFFVISGYLITLILLRELATGRFSIGRFYERRARRILPALVVVGLATLAMAWAWSLPDDLKRVGRSLTAVALFASNFFFWRNTDYFDPAADEQPLLHTWSLAVEEQYYVIFPLLLFALWRQSRSVQYSVLAIFLCLSFWQGLAHLDSDAAASFYLLPSRAWELLVGALIAYAHLYQHRWFARSHEGLAGIGLLLILFAIFVFDDHTPFPGPLASLPVVGAALVIAYAGEGRYVGRLLASSPLVGIGLISYSAYLWHQPLFAYARIYLLDEPSLGLVVGLILLTLLLAYLSWRFVETPFRDRNRISRRVIGYSSVAVLLAFSTIGVALHNSDGFAFRFNVPASVVSSIARTTAECFDKLGSEQNADWLCDLNPAQQSRTAFLLVGDSHMYSMIPAFATIADRLSINGKYVGYSGCPPLLTVHALRADQGTKNCHGLNERIRSYAVEHNVDTIVLVARWTYYTDGGYSGTDFSYIGLAPDSNGNPVDSFAAFREGLARTVEAYAKLGKQVVIVLQVPQQLYQPRDVYYFAYDHYAGEVGRVLSDLSVPETRHRQLQQRVNSAFAEIANAFPTTVRLWDAEGVLCRKGRCSIGDPDRSNYFDDDHLSVSGAEMVGARFAQTYADIWAKANPRQDAKRTGAE